MQSRYRSSGDGFRSGSGYRNPNPNRGGFRRAARPKLHPSPPQPRRKADIFMEAGRLAADYLVSKGLLPPTSLPVSWPNGRFQEFKRQEREQALPENRTSALARLGNPAFETGHRRRIYDDDFNRGGSRNHQRGRKRNGPYSRGYNSEWGSREVGRRGTWMDRARRYPDAIEEGEDDFAPGYPRVRRGGFDEVGSSSFSRVGSDERHSKSEVTGESGTEVDAREMADDTGSKASSSSTRKDPLAEEEADRNKPADNANILNSETGVEAKSETSGDLKKKKKKKKEEEEEENLQEESMDGQPCAEEGEPVTKHGDLLKLSGFAKVPTKPRSSAAHRSPRSDQVLSGEVGNIFEVADGGESEVIEGEEANKGSPSDVHRNQTNNSKYQAPDISSPLPDQSMEEPAEPQHKSMECPPGFGSSSSPVDEGDQGDFAQHVDKMEGVETQEDMSLPSLSQENKYSLQDLGTQHSSPCIGRFSTDEKMVEAVVQEEKVDANEALFPKAQPVFNVKLEEDKQLLTTSFDLNLVGTPDITEIHDDPVLDHIQTSGPILENGKEHQVGVGLSIGNNTNGTNDYNQLSDEDKVIQVINLEDDSPMEDNADSSKLKNDTLYSSLDNFLSPTAHADLDGMQDGYSLSFPEFLGTDISGCSSVPGELNNLQTGMSLHDAQGVPGDDDSIYVSLGEIPIGFMGVWDQPPQEYGKFF